MREPVLVILAAGMGSRYGGLKQIDAIGDNGESIIDFSIFDAIKAGFKKVYLIIKEEHRDVFENSLGKKIRPFIDVEYVYQDLDVLPAGFKRPQERVKPWGTTHALLACKGKVNGPFAIINADDYYGAQSFKMIYEFLKNEVSNKAYGIVAFEIGKTVSDNGSVTRAICTSEDDYMTDIVEIQKIFKDGDNIYYEENDKKINLKGDESTSMNYWGFDESIFELAEENFTDFMRNDFAGNPLKCELVIPTTIRELLAQGKIKVKMGTSTENWFGVTYQEDKPSVVKALKEMKENNVYPKDLWEVK